MKLSLLVAGCATALLVASQAIADNSQSAYCDTSRYSGSPNDADNWSNRLPADSTIDYFVNGSGLLTLGDAGNNTTTTFAGKSLTVGTDNGQTAGVLFLGLDGTGTTEFPCGIDIYNAVGSAINIVAGNKRIIDGEIRLHDDRCNDAQLQARMGSHDQTLEFKGKIVGNANTGMRFWSSSGENLNTNDNICFSGDLSEYYGYIQTAPWGGAGQNVVLQFGNVNFPGILYSEAGAQSVIRALTPTSEANISYINLSADSTLWVDVDIANNAAGCFKAMNTLVVGSSVWVTVNPLQDPVAAACPVCEYPVLVAPEGVTLDEAKFRLNVINLASDGLRGLFSLKVAPNDEGRSTLYVVKDEVPSPIHTVVNATWTGGAGANASIDAVDNWKEGLPSFLTGETLATFGEGGSEAVVSDTALAHFNGFRFTRDAFTVRGATDAAKVRLYAQGLGVSENLTATLGVTTEVFGDQTWTLGPGSVLNVMAPLLATTPYGSFNVTIQGGGSVNFEANGSTHTADITVADGGNVTLVGNEPVGTSGTLTLRQTVAAASGGVQPVLRMGNVTVSKDVVLDEEDDRAPVGWTTDGAVAEFKGAFRVVKGFSPSLTANARMIFSGGLSVGSAWTPGTAANAEFVISNKPMYANFWQADAPMLIAAQGCRVSHVFGLTFLWSESNLLRFGVEEAFSGNVNVTMTGQNNRMDLNGYSQTFGNLTQMVQPSVYPSGISKYGLITNSASRAATLHIVQTTEKIDPGYPSAWIGGQIAGPIDFWKDGPARIVVTNKIAAVGEIRITQGTFEFQPQATWRNATNVTVCGANDVMAAENARLAIAHSRNLNRHATLNLQNTGTVYVPSGVRLRVGKMTIDGEEQAFGIWRHGDTYSASAHTTPLITGGGEVDICGGGVALIVR